MLRFSLALLLAALAPSSAQTTHEGFKDEWYQRYPYYPVYCSTPDEMATRKIPVLSNDTRYGDVQIAHASVIVRHGARTPWTSDMNCWGGYWEDPDTRSWNCDLTMLTAPPSPVRIAAEVNPAGQATEAMFLFEKRYTALMDPADNLSNSLNGTCELGQLLMRGYEQEITNGQYLRSAYLEATNDPRMQLFNTSDSLSPWTDQNLFYRVDDDARTVMSGQVVIRGLLEPEINRYFDQTGFYPVLPVHTADRPRDIVAPNEVVCPRLVEIRQDIYASEEYQAYNTSAAAKVLRKFMADVLQVEGAMDITDCLMTTICTDRTLPAAIDDFGQANANTSVNSEYGGDMFERLFDFALEDDVLLFTANEAAYSKLSMGPIWAEIMSGIKGTIEGADKVCCPTRQPAKLELFAGHDTTIMPLLASLGPRVYDDKWAVYAGMMVIEIYTLGDNRDQQVFKSSHAFRLVQNDRILTDLVEGCPADSELCDADVLLALTAPFAKQDVDCSLQNVATTSGASSLVPSLLAVALLVASWVL